MKAKSSFLTLTIAALTMSALTVSCGNNVKKTSDNIPIVDKALNEISSNFYVNFAAYPKDFKSLPIGIFDSGTGGLTVAEKIISLDHFDNITGESGRKDEILDFAGESFIYLADQANMPYGNYDKEGKSEYLKELAVKDAIFLLGDRYYRNAFESQPSGIKSRVKIIVIACNTATAYSLKTIESMLAQSNSGVKVIGVINAGVKATLDQLAIQEDDEPVAIGVLATPGTISSGAYERTIKEELVRRKIKETKVDVVSQSGYGFAEAVDSEPDYVNHNMLEPRASYRGPVIGEEDADVKLQLMKAYNFDFSENRMLTSKAKDGQWKDFQLNHSVNYARFNIVSLVERHRQSGKTSKIKSIILGCTHYPFLLETLRQTIEELRDYREPDGTFPYKTLLADSISFIDPAVNTAVECYETLRADGNLAYRINEQKIEAYISVPSSTLSDKVLTPEGHLTYEYKYGRETGTEEISTKQVPFSKSNIDEDNLSRIEKLLPYTYSLIAPTLK